MPNSKSFRETCRLLASNDVSTTSLVNMEGEDLHGNGMGRLSSALSRNSVVTRLCLRHCYIHDADVSALVRCLRHNRRIDTVDLRDNFISRRGAGALGELLRGQGGSPGLRRLRLESNCIGDGGCRFLAEALCRNRSLVFLNLTDNDICADGGAALASGLRGNASLIYLNLSRNGRMGSLGAESVAKNCLKCPSPSRLAHLSLAETGMGDDGAAAVANALKANGTVRVLDLSQNGITSAGAASIASALEINASLRCVRLGRNAEVRDDGASNVAFALFRNEVLERLDLEGCGIGSVGASCLAIALQKNYALRRLDMDRNDDVREEVKNFIGEAVRRNSTHEGQVSKKAAFRLTRERAEVLPPPLKKGLLFVLWIANKIDAGRIMREEKPIGVDIWWTVLGMLCGSDLVPAHDGRGDCAEDLTAVFDSWLYPCGSRLEEFISSSRRGGSGMSG